MRKLSLMFSFPISPFPFFCQPLEGPTNESGLSIKPFLSFERIHARSFCQVVWGNGADSTIFRIPFSANTLRLPGVFENSTKTASSRLVTKTLVHVIYVTPCPTRFEIHSQFLRFSTSHFPSIGTDYYNHHVRSDYRHTVFWKIKHRGLSCNFPWIHSGPNNTI